MTMQYVIKSRKLNQTLTFYFHVEGGLINVRSNDPYFNVESPIYKDPMMAPWNKRTHDYEQFVGKAKYWYKKYISMVQK